MKKTQSSRRLHLVQATERSTASKQEMDTWIAEGVLQYQELQGEMDRALFANPQDVETLAVVMPKLQLLRERLASYGVRVH
jgi:hypothetical protein